MPYNRNDIEPRNTYAVSARIIEPEGRLIFLNDTAYDVITRGNPNRVEMLLVLVQPPSQLSDERESNNDWRTWIEVPVPVIRASLMHAEPERLLRVVYPQSTIEGCARPGNKDLQVNGYDITVRLTLMQPPDTPWAIPCDDETVELDEVFYIDSQLKTGKAYRVTVNDRTVSAFTLPDPALGHTVLTESPIRSAESDRGRGCPEFVPGADCFRQAQWKLHQVQRLRDHVYSARHDRHIHNPSPGCRSTGALHQRLSGR